MVGLVAFGDFDGVFLSGDVDFRFNPAFGFIGVGDFAGVLAFCVSGLGDAALDGLSLGDTGFGVATSPTDFCTGDLAGVFVFPTDFLGDFIGVFFGEDSPMATAGFAISGLERDFFADFGETDFGAFAFFCGDTFGVVFVTGEAGFGVAAFATDFLVDFGVAGFGVLAFLGETDFGDFTLRDPGVFALAADFGVVSFGGSAVGAGDLACVFAGAGDLAGVFAGAGDLADVFAAAGDLAGVFAPASDLVGVFALAGDLAGVSAAAGDLAGVFAPASDLAGVFALAGDLAWTGDLAGVFPFGVAGLAARSWGEAALGETLGENFTRSFGEAFFPDLAATATELDIYLLNELPFNNSTALFKPSQLNHPKIY